MYTQKLPLCGLPQSLVRLPECPNPGCHKSLPQHLPPGLPDLPPTPLGHGVDHDLHWAAHLIRKSLSRAERCLLEVPLKCLSSASRDSTEQVRSATQQPSDIIHIHSIDSNTSWQLLSAHRPPGTTQRIHRSSTEAQDKLGGRLCHYPVVHKGKLRLIGVEGFAESSTSNLRPIGHILCLFEPC